MRYGHLLREVKNCQPEGRRMLNARKDDGKIALRMIMLIKSYLEEADGYDLSN
jgi:hypothetical protein